MSDEVKRFKYRWFAVVRDTQGNCFVVSKDSQTDLKRELSSHADITVETVIRGKEFKVQTRRTFSFGGDEGETAAAGET